MTSDEIPVCCGEPMWAADRFKEKGHTYCTFVCLRGGCNNKKVVEVREDTYEECVR
jgi:hypothetical protein